MIIYQTKNENHGINSIIEKCNKEGINKVITALNKIKEKRLPLNLITYEKVTQKLFKK
jgi:hypothetical protein